MQLFSILLDILNLIAFFFSAKLALNRTISGLTFVAAVAFSLILALEYFRKRDVEHIMNEPPPLDRHDFFMLTFSSVKPLKVAEIEEWKIKKQKEAQEKSATYLNWEKTLFGIGIIITLVIAYFIFFPVSL